MGTTPPKFVGKAKWVLSGACSPRDPGYYEASMARRERRQDVLRTSWRREPPGPYDLFVGTRINRPLLYIRTSPSF
jgi:hypothetical protein